MAESDTLNWDVTGADHEAREAREQPKPGLYEAVIKSAVNEVKIKDKTDRTHVVFELTKGKYKGSQLHLYIAHQENMKWKMDELLMAVGIDTAKKEKGKGSLKQLMVGKPVVISVKAEEYNNAYKAGMGNVYKWKALAASDDDFEEASEPEDDDTDPDEVEEDEVEEDEPEEDEELEEDEDDGLEELDRGELKRLLSSEGIDFKVFKSTTDEAIVEAIRAARGGDTQEEEEDDTPPAKGGKKSADPYADLDVAGLKAELKERGLKVGGTEAALRARLKTNDEDPFG